MHGKLPFKNLISHGFVLDAQKRKMSKSEGNVISPGSIIHGGDGFKAQGDDVLRMWAASQDFNSNVSISKETVSQISEAKQKIRNTIRFLLGNLRDFDLRREIPFENLLQVN